MHAGAVACVASTALHLLAGEMVIIRPIVKIATICQQMPALRHTANADAGHLCLPHINLTSLLQRRVLVRQGGWRRALPNVHPQLLLLAQFKP